MYKFSEPLGCVYVCVCACKRARVPYMFKTTHSFSAKAIRNEWHAPISLHLRLLKVVICAFSAFSIKKPRRPSFHNHKHFVCFSDRRCLCDGSTKRSWHHVHLIATNSLVSRLSVNGSGEVFFFFFFPSNVQMWVSEETMYMCKTFATISTEGKYVTFLVQYCSWWLWYPLVAVLYLMVMASQRKALVC